jgi:SlyX protein
MLIVRHALHARTGPRDQVRIMTDTDTLSARIDALEMSKAHQDRAIEDLSEALAAQWKEIEALRAQVARLTERLAEAAAAGAGGEVEPPPPHY